MPCCNLFCFISLSRKQREFISISFKRAFQRIDAAPNVGSHFYILFRLIGELLPALIIVAVIKTTNYLKKIKTNHSIDFKLSAFLLWLVYVGHCPLC